MKYLNALNRISGVGPQRMSKLMSFFKEAEMIWKASIQELILSGLPEKLAHKIDFERTQINPQEEWEKLEKEEIKVIPLTSPLYPLRLKESSRPPYLLYLKGHFQDLNHSPMLAIVGSRKCTSYGQQAAYSFAGELARAGLVIVSGLALGIDTFAHQGTLEANGKTIAVLGNSLDDLSIYPRNNLLLSKRIRENGALLSEYPPETPAGILTFPARNRIIAGLTLGTLVIEAAEGSGALITSRLALEYNREVLAVPGSIYSPASSGTNNLIKNGAKLVTSIKDILEELNFELEKKETSIITKEPSSPEEELILRTLSSDPLHIDNLVKITKLKTSTINSLITLMELKGWVKNIGGQNYIIM